MKTLAVAMVATLALSATMARAQPYPADNSGKNVRDRSDTAVTAADQSNSESDVAITRAIRKSVMADSALSTNAHNVKIVTIKGVVTLRGPVNSADEKAAVLAKAQQTAGVTRVHNELEVASK